MANLELCVVGSVALDSVETVRGKRDEVLGGSASFICAAASFFVPKTRLVAIVGDDMPRGHLDYLASRGADMSGLEVVKGGRTFRWAGRYAPDFITRESLNTELGVFAGFQPRLPDSYRSADLLFLGNIDPVLQLDVLEQIKKPKLVALDTMNYWISRKPAELGKVLARVDAVLLNDEEARQLSGESNLQRAARVIHAMGPTIVVIKRGEHGALLVHPHGVFAAPAYPIDEVCDPTGAGDTFAGGFMGSLACAETIDDDSLRRAMIHGSSLASYCVEDFSLDRLRALEKPDVERRFGEFRELMRF